MSIFIKISFCIQILYYELFQKISFCIIWKDFDYHKFDHNFLDFRNFIRFD